MAEGEADVVEAVQQAVLAERVDVEVGVEALVVGDGLGFEVDGDLVLRVCGASAARRVSTSSSVRRARMMPFLPALEKKMSAKVGAMTARKPYWLMAQAACSRELPQPKFFSAMRISAPLYSGLLRTKSGRGSTWSGVVEVVAPVEEEEVAVAGALDALEELLGDDLVRVDVGQRQTGRRWR